MLNLLLASLPLLRIPNSNGILEFQTDWFVKYSCGMAIPDKSFVKYVFFAFLPMHALSVPPYTLRFSIITDCGIFIFARASDLSANGISTRKLCFVGIAYIIYTRLYVTVVLITLIEGKRHKYCWWWLGLSSEAYKVRVSSPPFHGKIKRRAVTLIVIYSNLRSLRL